MQHFVVQIANEQHLHYAETICNEMESSAKSRGTGIAKRTPEYIQQKMLEGKAVIALTKTQQWAGFCYIETWSHGKYVANSGLIVSPEFRKSGLAKLIKQKIFQLSTKKYPAAKIFGLTTGLAVMKINSDLGYQPVTYSELTQDIAFWKGCENCINHSILKNKEHKNCLCTAMLYNPHEKTKARWFDIKNKQKVMERLLQLKQTAFMKLLKIKKNKLTQNLNNEKQHNHISL